MLKGRESAFTPLHQLDTHEWFQEMSIFITLLSFGLATNLIGLASASTVLRTLGTLVTTLGINSFVLLMPREMRFVLFKNRAANR